MKPNKVAILVNLDAKQGMAKYAWKEISHDVLNYFPEDTLVLTYSIPFDIEQVILELINSKKVDGFVSAGGDGSLNFVLNAIIKTQKDNAKNFYLGSIGLGSSNDFLKPNSNKIKKIPVRMNWLKSRLADVGLVQYENSKGKQKTRYFVINANMGVTASANYSFNNPGKILAFLKKKWTNLAIMFAALNGIFCYRNYPVNMLIDKTLSKEIQLSNLSVIKNPNISGKFRYSQKIVYNDGFLGLNYCNGMTKYELIATLFGLLKGKFIANSKRETYKIKSLDVISKDLVPIETDGEVFLGNKIRFKILPKTIYTMGS